MKKSTLVMILCLVLAVALGVGGTLAYLTDTDADVNVMVMGDVQIVQNEQQRIEQGNAEEGLEEFEQYKSLLPYVTIGNTTKENVTVGDYTIKMRDNVKNYVDKIVTVTNIGNNDAFVRTIIAVPTGEIKYTPATQSDNWLHWNYVSDTDTTPNNGWYYGENDGLDLNATGNENGVPTGIEEWEGRMDQVNGVDINGVEYDLFIFTNKNVIAPGETTGPNMVGLYLDSRVDKDENGYFIRLTPDDDKYYIAIEDPSNVQILVASQAVQADGFEEAGAWYALDAAFGDISADNHPWSKGMPEVGSPDGDKNDTNNPPAQFTGDPQELATLLSEATDAESGDVTIELTDNYDMSGYDWTPISVDGYHGAGIVTVKGNGHTIKNLNAPLFAGGFAGESGIVIEDLTIADSTMTAPTDQGSGAFICCADSMTTITLDNCHAKNVTLNGASRTGGLVGWTSGYSRQDDGPVKSYVTLKDCTVEGCTINAETESAGGLIGHSGASDWTFTTVTNCSVIDTEINGGNGKTGVYVGTANVGETTLTGCSYEDVTGNVNTEHPEYGRFVPGTTGKLTIDGNEI